MRLFIPSIAGFPVNDGGLFSVMIKSIQDNGMRLPAYFQYNGQNIPFAYPPFAFYVGAFASNIFHLTVIDIVRWMPAVILIGTIPAFFYLARAILKTSYAAGLATLAFAFTPRTMTWPIMGGGLTRSFGLLFLLLALGNIYRLFNERARKYLILSIAFSVLVVLTHPEATVHTIAFALIFWAFKGRNKGGTIHALTIALGTIAVTSTWWISTLIRLGPDPFLAAAQTGSHSALSIFYPFMLTLTDETFLTIIAVLGLVGLVVCLAQKNYFLPALYVVPYLVDPRSSATYAMIPLAIMAGLALSDVILPALARIGRQADKPGIENPFQNQTALTFLVVLGLYMFGGTMYFGAQITGTAVSAADRAAFGWIRLNTPAESRFLVITGEKELFCDGVQEWFPVLTDRVSITTVQGDEWLPNKKFIQAANLQNGVQNCTMASSPLNCIDQNKLSYDYIYIARKSMLKNFCRAVASVMRSESLIAALAQDSQYHIAYQTDAVAIYTFQH